MPPDQSRQNLSDPNQNGMNLPQKGSSEKRQSVLKGLILLVLLMLVVLAALVINQVRENAISQPQPNTKPSASTPVIDVKTIASGRSHIWEIVFLPTGQLLFSERNGTINLLSSNGIINEITRIPDVFAAGEGGLMGMAVDPSFSDNNFIYTCFNTRQDIRVVRWKLADDLGSLLDRKEVITGIISNTERQPGRHSGCRVGFGLDGHLWVGTGDAALGDASIQPKGLGGKVLRVDREGRPAPGNLDGEFDDRIFSYGHRNTQGLSFFKAPKNGVDGVSIEHGSGVDDEVNELRAGNFGWAPPAGDYNERGVPMTDTDRFPDAIKPLWASGSSTQAPSGSVIINGSAWRGWDGALAIAFLKAEHLKILRLDEKNKVTQEERFLSEEYGRLRAVSQGPDGSLYVGTSNGSDDKILKLTPRAE